MQISNLKHNVQYQVGVMHMQYVLLLIAVMSDGLTRFNFVFLKSRAGVTGFSFI